jgi:hypothetical protein
MRAITQVQQGRTIFTTKCGRLGFSKGSMKRGDQVCLFDGATAPYLIRKCEDGITKENTYILLGEVYLHGVMYGEVDTFDLEPCDILLV